MKATIQKFFTIVVGGVWAVLPLILGIYILEQPDLTERGRIIDYGQLGGWVGALCFVIHTMSNHQKMEIRPEFMSRTTESQYAYLGHRLVLGAAAGFTTISIVGNYQSMDTFTAIGFGMIAGFSTRIFLTTKPSTGAPHFP